jgi:hypothetical protein
MSFLRHSLSCVSDWIPFQLTRLCAGQYHLSRLPLNTSVSPANSRPSNCTILIKHNTTRRYVMSILTASLNIKAKNIFTHGRAGWDMVASYSGSAAFESMAGHRLSRDFFWFFLLRRGKWQSISYIALCYKPKGRGFQTPWSERIFSIYLLLPSALGPGLHSASNRNEYPEQKSNVSGE